VADTVVKRVGTAARAHAARRAAPQAVPNAPAAAQAARTLTRVSGLDALRGLAIVAMAAYHFAFDLRWFGLARIDFEHDPRWIAARSAILASFLLIAGVSLVLASRRPDFQRRFVRNVARIVGAALLVSVASRLAFPQSWIWFGVLHAIAVALLLALPLVHRPRLAFAVGALVVILGALARHPMFDAAWLQWIGFMTHRPYTEDYVPLFPWAGLVLVGVALGHALVQHPGSLRRIEGPAWLRFLGRHSLVTYLVHQPILLGLLWLVAR
jgi:uncharacterized membrane protein